MPFQPSNPLKYNSSTEVGLKSSAVSVFQGNTGGLTLKGGTATGDHLDHYANNQTFAAANTGRNRFFERVSILPSNQTISAACNLVEVTGQTFTMDNSSSNIAGYNFGSTINYTFQPIFGVPPFLFYSHPTVSISSSILLGAMPSFFSNITYSIATGVTLTLSDAYAAIWDSPVFSRSGTGVLDGAAGYTAFVSDMVVNTGLTLVDRTAFRIDDATGAGTITNQYGLRIPALTKGTNNYGIHSSIAAAANRWFIYEAGGADSSIKGELRLGDNTAPTAQLDIAGKTTVEATGLVSRYNNIATVSNGVPAEYATVDLTAQAASIAATTAYAVPASGAGTYRVSWVATVTRAATTSSTLGPFQISYTDADDSVVKTQVNLTGFNSSTANTTATAISGTFVCRAKASTNIQYVMGYTSSGATTMQYNLHLKVEAL